MSQAGMPMSLALKTESVESNHPLALRMAVVAFVNQNITIACIWGSFSVLLGSVEARLGVGRELSTLAVPVVNLATAALAPVVGALAIKHSLRVIMLLGAALSVAGFAVLALTASYPLYLAAFGLLLGPGMAVGAVLPATLVTRWYKFNRGRALGIVCAPIVIALVPLVSNWILQSYGLTAAYATLAALSVVTLIANFFVIDRPPGSDNALLAADASGARGLATEGAMTMAQLLRSPLFWALMLAFIASVTGSIVITSQMVPVARTWGMSATLAATLLSIQSLAGIGGTVLFGWVADRVGGALALAILVFNAAVLWMLLLFQPSFAAASVIVALIGVHGAGVIPVLSVALSETFGRETFSRAYGLVNLVNLPFAVVSVPAAAMVYARTGSYAGAIVGQAAFLALGSLLVLFARRRRANASA
jgi:MFS family permease